MYPRTRRALRFPPTETNSVTGAARAAAAGRTPTTRRRGGALEAGPPVVPERRHQPLDLASAALRALYAGCSTAHDELLEFGPASSAYEFVNCHSVCSPPVWSRTQVPGISGEPAHPRASPVGSGTLPVSPSLPFPTAAQILPGVLYNHRSHP